MNPDAVFGQPLGAAPILPTKLITRVNDPGQPPQRERVAKALKELQQAAASIPAGCNDHDLGHLGLVVSDAECTTKSNGRPHVPPANPGPSPTIPAVANLDQQRDRAIRGHCIEKGHCNLYEQVNTALKNLLLDSIDAVYINHLEDDMLGFQPVTIRQIIDSITDRYLKFNETQKEELEKQLEKQHDGGPIDTHIATFNKVFKAANPSPTSKRSPSSTAPCAGSHWQRRHARTGTTDRRPNARGPTCSRTSAIGVIRRWPTPPPKRQDIMARIWPHRPRTIHFFLEPISFWLMPPKPSRPTKP